MKSSDEFLNTCDESTGKESADQFCAVVIAYKDTLTDGEKTMFLATYQAIIQTWTDINLQIPRMSGSPNA